MTKTEDTLQLTNKPNTASADVILGSEIESNRDAAETARWAAAWFIGRLRILQPTIQMTTQLFGIDEQQLERALRTQMDLPPVKAASPTKQKRSA